MSFFFFTRDCLLGVRTYHVVVLASQLPKCHGANNGFLLTSWMLLSFFFSFSFFFLFCFFWYSKRATSDKAAHNMLVTFF